MLRPTRLITIVSPDGQRQIELSTPKVEINDSRTSLTNTATITCARRLNILNGNISDVLARGSHVTIALGYNGQNTVRFSGYVTSVDAKVPLTIKCEDEMWKLKQNSFTASFNNTKVADIVKMVYSGPAKVADLTIGGWVIKRQNTAQVLQGLKKFGLQSYFQNGVLIVDFAGALQQGYNHVAFDFNKNIIGNDLEYKRKDDTRIKVRGVSKLSDGSKIEIVAGDADGEEHTLHYAFLNKSNLQKIVNSEIARLKQDGFIGTFTTYGWPMVSPGDVVVFTDSEYPEHNGSYLVEGVDIIDDAGLRQKVKLERQMSV